MRQNRWFVSLIWIMCACGSDTNTQTQTTPDIISDDTAQISEDAPTNTVDTCAGAPDGTLCEDGNVCTIDDVCESGFCVGSQNRICKDEGPCRTGTCDPEIGCVYEDAIDGDSCNIACFSKATCEAGACNADPNAAIDCPSPSKPCVDQLKCDSKTGACTIEIYSPIGAGCNTDADVCTLETCDAVGQCKDTGQIDTCKTQQQNNPCWTYSCNKKGGCVQTAFVEGVSCNDGNPCTSSDQCVTNDKNQKLCVGSPVPTDDNNPCTDDACIDGEVTHTAINGAPCVLDNGCNSTGLCDEGNCVTKDTCECTEDEDCDPPDDLCSGKMVCQKSGKSAQCVLDEKQATVCPAATEQCQVAACNPKTGECETQTLTEGPCDDNDACTLDDQCTDGGCTGGKALVCDDGLACNGQEVCDAIKGCLKGKALECDDGNACNGTETCSDDSGCVMGTPLQCDDANACNGVESCNEATGCTPGKALICDDKDPCNGAEACDKAQGCTSGTPLKCDDGNVCNGTEVCTKNKGCTNGAPLVCDDGDPCNGAEGCSATTGCTQGTPLKCDDGNACNGQEICDSDKGCTQGTPLQCDDGKACNGIEVCTKNKGCTNGAPLVCDDGNACNGAETCNDNTGCAQGTPLQCDDGQACNGTETCDKATGCVKGIALQCDDGDPCNGQETCSDSGGCESGKPLQCDDGNVCNGKEVCTQGQGCTNSEALQCDDGNACNGLELCDKAKGCQPGTALKCNDGDACNGLEYCHPPQGCVTSQSNQNGVPQPVTPLNCNDGIPCTQDSCDTVKGCLNSPDKSVCGAAGKCHSMACVPGQGCVETPLPNCCGNGKVEAGEQCDDANPAAGDGCTDQCKLNGLPQDCMITSGPGKGAGCAGCDGLNALSGPVKSAQECIDKCNASPQCVSYYVEVAGGNCQLFSKGDAKAGQSACEGTDNCYIAGYCDNKLDCATDTQTYGQFVNSGQSLGKSYTYSSSLGDLDDDGDIDVYTVNYDNQPDEVWLNNGKGAFTNSGQKLGSGNGQDVRLADFDGDGDLDAFVTNYSGGHTLWLNNGNAKFTDSGQLLGNSNDYAMTIGDIDGDKDIDVITAGQFTGPRLWVNNGKGVFAQGASFGGADVDALVLGDLDGDQDLDLFSGRQNGAPNQVFFNNGKGIYMDSGQKLGKYSTDGAGLGDLDGDGDLDAVTANRVGHPSMIWLNNGSGVFSAAPQNFGSGNRQEAQIADVDEDGDNDVLLGGDGGEVQVWFNGGNATFVLNATLPGSGTVNSLDLANLDGDCDLDIFIGREEKPNHVWFNEPNANKGCGNGTLEPGEDCDDGNKVNGDGCSASCLALGSQANPAVSCKAILDVNSKANNGTYWLKPDPQQSAFQTFCDMIRDGGGWTLIAGVHRANKANVNEPNAWFINGQNKGPLTTNKDILDATPSSLGVAPFMKRITAQIHTARFDLHAHLDWNTRASWFKEINSQSFQTWFTADKIPTRVCTNVGLTQKCKTGTIAPAAGRTVLNGMNLSDHGYFAGEDIHMRLNNDSQPQFSAVYSATEDKNNNQWPDTAIDGNWGNGLRIWIREPECGNQLKEPGEQCDDGNQIDDDTCTNSCTKPMGGKPWVAVSSMTAGSVTIWKPDGTQKTLGKCHQPWGMEFEAPNSLYVACLGSPDTIEKLNIDTGQQTTLHNQENNNRDLAFGPDGTLFVAIAVYKPVSLMTINTTTGALSPYIDVGGMENFGLSADKDGTLYWGDSQGGGTIYKIPKGPGSPSTFKTFESSFVLRDVEVGNDDWIYVAGLTTNNPLRIYNKNGNPVSSMSAPGKLWSVDPVNIKDIYVLVEKNGVYHWDGNNWTWLYKTSVIGGIKLITP